MKKLLFSLACGLSLASSAALADVVLTTGSKGGTYHNVLGANMERIAAGEAAFGFTQADAFASWTKQHPTANLELLGSLGKECIYVAVKDDGPVGDEDDLQGKKIAVGEKGSGSAVSWDYLRSLEDDYADTSTYYQGGIRALAKVKMGSLDAFLWVTSPTNLDHEFLRAVMQEGSGLRLIDVNDYDLNDTLPNGESVYSFEDVVVEKGLFDTTVEVPCTSVMAVATPDMDSEALEAAATAIMMNAKRIQGL